MIMGDVEVELPRSEESCSQKKLWYCSEVILRGLVFCSTLATTSIILTAKQSVVIFGIPFDARYTYSSSFKFFAFANAIACGFSLLSLCLLFLSRRRFPLRNQTNHILFLHDLLMMGLVMSGCAAATAIGFVGKYGNSHTGWSPICDNFGKFCNSITISVAISYFAVLCLLILTIISANLPRPPSSNNNL